MEPARIRQLGWVYPKRATSHRYSAPGYRVPVTGQVLLLLFRIYVKKK